MEERALYRAILAAPHDDAARLIYADWLDENADALPAPVANAERARAAFIRLQCKAARFGPGGWKQTNPTDFAIAKRLHQLNFRHGRKWRNAFPAAIASAPFERGFLRPFRALRPAQFLGLPPTNDSPARPPTPPLADDSPARRYVPDEPFAACPLWDVHLFASDWQDDPLRDTGRCGKLLECVGRSPELERVGWLKVSFFRTSVYDFLRRGHFPNVETLVLNSGPFPEVLEAVAENESFSSLRYVMLGTDWWSWAGTYPAMLQYITLLPKLEEANQRHLPHGEMRAALRSILRDTPLVPAAPAPTPMVRLAPRPFGWSPAPASERGNGTSVGLFALLGMLLLFAKLIDTKDSGKSPPTVPSFKMATYEPYKFDPELFKPKYSPEVEAALKQMREGKSLYDPRTDPFLNDPEIQKMLREGREWQKRQPLPVAPAPRPAARRD